LEDPTSVFSQDDDSLFTLKEMLLNSKLSSNGGEGGRKPPRPSSIPAAKKFGGVSYIFVLSYSVCKNRLEELVRVKTL
jgi:hypothetical protein